MDETGKRHVKAFGSRVVQPAEKKTSFTHFKIIAVVWALQHLRYIIMGFQITAHNGLAAITEIFRGKNLSGPLARWYLTIQTHNPDIKYVPGKSSVVVAALSRNIPAGAINGTPVRKIYP